jgi:predicted NBD/HSP70 family sugar kinase
MVIRGESGLAQAEIRRLNLSRMLRQLHVSGPLTRSELASDLSLNRSTVASLIGELAARGLVWEHGRAKGSPQAPGRPSPLVELRRDGPGALAIDLSTDWIGAAIIGLGGAVIASTRRDQSLANADPQWVVDQMHTLVAPLLQRLSNGPRIVAIGVSVPGAVRAEDGRLHHAPNLGWRDVPMGDLMRERFAKLAVPVFIGNDADLAASAEHLRGSGRGSSDFICLWGEGGIGAGFVVGGRSLAGSAGYAGEVGHLTVNPGGNYCHCGARGCWEAEVGEEALLRRSGRDPLGGAPALADLLAAADRGDRVALAALAESGRWLGIGIAGLVNVFNPSRVSLGGLYARIYPYVKEAVARELDSRAMPAPRAMVELTTASLGANALLLGAAELALAPTLYDPTIVPLPSESANSGFRGSASPRSEQRNRRQSSQGGTSQGGDSTRDFSWRPSVIPI